MASSASAVGTQNLFGSKTATAEQQTSKSSNDSEPTIFSLSSHTNASIPRKQNLQRYASLIASIISPARISEPAAQNKIEPTKRQQQQLSNSTADLMPSTSKTLLSARTIETKSPENVTENIVKSPKLFGKINFETLQTLINNPSKLYWHRAVTHGKYYSPKRLRSHTATLIDSKLYIFGGIGDRECYSDLSILDLDTLNWSECKASGDLPTSRRAHSATAVGTNYIYVFGGGDGNTYLNQLFLFDTRTKTWFRLVNIGSVPCARRAHAACFDPKEYGIFVFGGGDGKMALNDLYLLRLKPATGRSAASTTDFKTESISYLTPVWEKWETFGDLPEPRGYHSMNLIDDKLIIVGGSNGEECFSNLHILDLDTKIWIRLSNFSLITQQPSNNSVIKNSSDGSATPIELLAHTSIVIGNQILIVGGDNVENFVSDVLILNLRDLTIEKKWIAGLEKMPARGYHTCVYYDGKLIIIGGYNGNTVFSDVWILHLTSFAMMAEQDIEIPWETLFSFTGTTLDTRSQVSPENSTAPKPVQLSLSTLRPLNIQQKHSRHDQSPTGPELFDPSSALSEAFKDFLFAENQSSGKTPAPRKLSGNSLKYPQISQPNGMQFNTLLPLSAEQLKNRGADCSNRIRSKDAIIYIDYGDSKPPPPPPPLSLQSSSTFAPATQPPNDPSRLNNRDILAMYMQQQDGQSESSTHQQSTPTSHSSSTSNLPMDKQMPAGRPSSVGDSVRSSECDRPISGLEYYEFPIHHQDPSNTDNIKN